MHLNLTNYFNIVKDAINNYFNEENEEVREIVFSKIKQNILIKIYDKIFPELQNNDDKEFYYLTISLSWIEPKHLIESQFRFDNFLSLTNNYFDLIDIEKSPMIKFELIDKIITVQPLEVLSSTEKTKLIKFIEFPLGEEKVLNIGVIYKVTSLY